MPELCRSALKVPNKTAQFKPCAMESSVEFLNNIGKTDGNLEVKLFILLA